MTSENAPFLFRTFPAKLQDFAISDSPSRTGDKWYGTTAEPDAIFSNILVMLRYGAQAFLPPLGKGVTRGQSFMGDLLVQAYLDRFQLKCNTDYMRILAALNYLEVSDHVENIDDWTYYELTFKKDPRFRMVCRVPTNHVSVVSLGVQVFWQATIDPNTHQITSSLGPTLTLADIRSHIGDLPNFLSIYTSQYLTDFIGFYSEVGTMPIQQLWELFTVYSPLAGNSLPMRRP